MPFGGREASLNQLVLNLVYVKFSLFIILPQSSYVFLEFLLCLVFSLSQIYAETRQIVVFLSVIQHKESFPRDCPMKTGQRWRT